MGLLKIECPQIPIHKSCLHQQAALSWFCIKALRIIGGNKATILTIEKRTRAIIFEVT